MPSFDVVSRVDMQEMDNAVNQAVKEIGQRWGKLNGLVCSAGLLRIGALASSSSGLRDCGLAFGSVAGNARLISRRVSLMMSCWMMAVPSMRLWPISMAPCTEQ